MLEVPGFQKRGCKSDIVRISGKLHQANNADNNYLLKEQVLELFELGNVCFVLVGGLELVVNLLDRCKVSLKVVPKTITYSTLSINSNSTFAQGAHGRVDTYHS